MSAWFVDAMLDNSPTRLKSRALHWTLSFAAHGLLLATMLVVPLCRIDGIEMHRSNYTPVASGAKFANVQDDALRTYFREFRMMTQPTRTDFAEPSSRETLRRWPPMERTAPAGMGVVSRAMTKVPLVEPSSSRKKSSPR